MNNKRFFFIALFLILVNTSFLSAQQNVLKFTQNITPKFSLKLSGGMNYILNGGNTKEWFKSETNFFSWLNTQSNYEAQSDFKFTHTSPETNLEAFINLTQRFSLGVGVGYFKKSWQPNSTVTYNYGDTLGTDTLNHSININAKIIPITVTGIYSIPTRIFDFNVMAGIGYYISSFKFTDENTHSWPNSPEKQDYKYTYSFAFETNSGKLGFHFGGGVGIKLLSRISLTIDALYRMVKFDELKGDIKWKETISWAGNNEESSGTANDQTLWYGNYKLNGNTFYRASFNSAKPDWLENAQPFEFKLNGLVVKTGIKIVF